MTSQTIRIIDDESALKMRLAIGDWKLIHALARYFDDQNGRTVTQKAIKDWGSQYAKQLRSQGLENEFNLAGTMERLVNFGLLKTLDHGDRFHITWQLVRLSYAEQSKPPKNTWLQFKTWFFAHWWSVPLILILLGIPILKEWLEIVNMLILEGAVEVASD